ncbi:hypothetical protein H4S01_003014 [Coemansia sp. RSA 2610]|nr:hypothetical protein H4S01_003014 [Coemansia sp. RSA 2610]
MDCGVCAGSKPRGFCGACVRERWLQHAWLDGVVRAGSSRQEKHTPEGQQTHEVYEWQARRLQARRQRVAQLRTLIGQRQDQIAAARQLRDTLQQQQQECRDRLAEDKDGLAEGKDRLAKDKDGLAEGRDRRRARWQRAQAQVRADRRVLAQALGGVAGLRLQGGAALDERLFGLPWPQRADWAKYPAAYIEACVGHAVHVFSVLAHYLHARLPFYAAKRGGRLYMRAAWRRADAPAAELAVSPRARFVVALGMLFCAIAELCRAQGVAAPEPADVVGNMRRAVCALAEPPPAATPPPLDVYAAVVEAMRLYADAARPAAALALREAVHAELRRLHLCDDAVDAADRDDASSDDENWAII